MLNLSLIGGFIFLLVLIYVSNILKLDKIKNIFIMFLFCGLAVIGVWEFGSGAVLYILGDMLETMLEYWGACLVGLFLIIGFLVYRYEGK